MYFKKLFCIAGILCIYNLRAMTPRHELIAISRPPTPIEEPELLTPASTTSYETPASICEHGFPDGLPREFDALVRSLSNADRFLALQVQPTKYYFLTGPKDEQKIELAQIASRTTHAPLFYLNASAMPCMGISALRDLFIKASEKPCAIVFIDNTEDIASRTLTELYAQLNKYKKNNIFVIFAAQTELVLQTFKEHFSPLTMQSIFICPPGPKTRTHIFKQYLLSKNCYEHRDDPAAVDAISESFAARTEGFMASELRNIINEAVRIMVLGGSPELHNTELNQALEIVTAQPRYATMGIRKLCADQRPKTSFADIVGPIPREIKQLITFIKHPERFEVVPRGILFVGPSGTGKTMLARAIAHEVDGTFFPMNATDLVGKHLGDCARNVRDLFVNAQEATDQTRKPAIIFFDEFDSIGKKRSLIDGECNKERTDMVNTLLTHMDGLERKNIFVIAATNYAQSLDTAFRAGRFDFRIPFGRPQLEARTAILEHYLHKTHYAGDLSAAHLICRQLAERTGGFTHADLEGIIKNAAFLAVNPDGAPEEDNVTNELLFQEWDKMKHRLREMTEEQIVRERIALTFESDGAGAPAFLPYSAATTPAFTRDARAAFLAGARVGALTAILRGAHT